MKGGGLGPLGLPQAGLAAGASCGSGAGFPVVPLVGNELWCPAGLPAGRAAHSLAKGRRGFLPLSCQPGREGSASRCLKDRRENKVASETGCLHKALDPVHVMWVLIQVVLAGQGQLCAGSSGAPSLEARVSSWPWAGGLGPSCALCRVSWHLRGTSANFLLSTGRS